MKSHEQTEETLLQLARLYYAQCTRKRIAERDSHEALHKVRRRISQNAGRMFVRRVAVAASLFFGMVGIGSFLLQNIKSEEASSQLITVNSNAGMRSELTLPDGTTVRLNAGSTLVYPSKYDRDERRVRLSGEAYFDVTSRPNQPFVVGVCDDRLTVRVLGTEFNIRSYENDSLVETTLTEGSIELGIRGLKGNVKMSPSEKATYDLKTGRVGVQKTDPYQEIAWKEGVLIFRDTPMPEVLRRLSHFYSVTFDIRDEEIAGYLFTGAFDNRPLSQILDYMKISSKIDHSITYPDHRRGIVPVVDLTLMPM